MMTSLLSTKRYGHEVGLSCTFRQWRATSHCKLLHGYALAFKFIFQATHLDEHNWVVDFGGLKELKQALEHWFDHTLVVAIDDPYISMFRTLDFNGLAIARFLPNVGCEAFAAHAFNLASAIVNDARVQVVSCECAEHAGNSAIYMEEFTRGQ